MEVAGEPDAPDEPKLPATVSVGAGVVVGAVVSVGAVDVEVTGGEVLDRKGGV